VRTIIIKENADIRLAAEVFSDHTVFFLQYWSLGTNPKPPDPLSWWGWETSRKFEGWTHPTRGEIDTMAAATLAIGEFESEVALRMEQAEQVQASIRAIRALAELP
jgi:hypothetical protein